MAEPIDVLAQIQASDAGRDCLALLRAARAGDREGLVIVAVNLAEPAVTAGVLACWLAHYMDLAERAGLT